MTPTASPPAPRRRSNISLTESDAHLLRKLADKTDEGNRSRLIRRLLREEAERVKKEDES